MEIKPDWQNTCTSSKERNLHLLRTALQADCRFLVGVEEEKQELIKAHKFLLFKSSPAFEAMFFGNLPETGDKAIIIDDAEAEDFKDFLEYFYTDEINIKSVKHAQKIYYLAEKYLVNQVKKNCTDYLSILLHPPNACEIFEFAKRYGNKQLEEACLQVIIEKTTYVIAADSFYAANLSTLETLMSQKKLNIPAEWCLFKALEKYASRCHTETELEGINQLVKKIRFLTMTYQDFVLNVCFSPLLKADESRDLLACICIPDMVSTRFPRGFCSLKESRNPKCRCGYYRDANGSFIWYCS